jgi:hypothetical protein
VGTKAFTFEVTVGTKDEKMMALNLEPDEKANLVSFLMTLRMAPLPTPLLEDTSSR